MSPEHARRIIWRRLDEARQVKARIDAGTAFSWEPARLSSLVHEARSYSRALRDLEPRQPRLHSDACGLSYKLVCNPRSTPDV
jgi:hypothetical protein